MVGSVLPRGPRICKLEKHGSILGSRESRQHGRLTLMERRPIFSAFASELKSRAE